MSDKSFFSSNLFGFTPGSLSAKFREVDMKNRAYLAIGSFWNQVAQILEKDGTEAEQGNDLRPPLDKLREDLKKLYSRVKEGDDFKNMNALEKLNDSFMKTLHRTVIGQMPGLKPAMKEVQISLEELWVNFFNLEYLDGVPGFERVFAGFEVDFWDALGLGEVPEPMKESPGEEELPEDYRLEGKGEAVYCVVNLKKEEIKRSIPASLFDFKDTGLDLPADEHPVIFVFAKQHIVEPFETAYQEFFLLVPHLHVVGHPEHTFQAICGLYVNLPEIAKGARTTWHMNKLAGAFTEVVNFPLPATGKGASKNTLSISTESQPGTFTEHDLVQVAVEVMEKEGKVADFAAMQKLMPLLDTLSIYWEGQDLWAANFKIDFSKARVRPAKANFDTKSFLGSPDRTYSLDSISESPLGAFFLSFDWSMDLPISFPPAKN